MDMVETEPMDEITFRSDTVLSDVHLNTPNKKHLMVRLNNVGQPVFLTNFKLLWTRNAWEESQDNEKLEIKSRGQVKADREFPSKAGSDPDFLSKNRTQGSPCRAIEALLDEDGDLDVVRRSESFSDLKQEPSRDKVHPIILTQGAENLIEEEEQGSFHHDFVKIEHTMATPLVDAGKQVWRGAFLLADYILFKNDLFKNRTVLELGAGTGITSIITGTIAKTVYCTDVGEDLLVMCERNVTLNKHLTEPKGGTVKVRELDWLKDGLCTDPRIPYSWSEDEIADLHDHTTIVFAADVFYDDDLTDALFKTLYRITHNLKNPCTVYLSIEKRLNFTLRHLDVTCEAYNHFRCSLSDLENLEDGKMRFTVEPIETTFPQFLVYERVEQLELWKIIAEPLT
ncbi:methyltransferase-like protein 22 isoform X2 [Tachyglossus aculeatus]|uniref:methyltransferase-like protein 22 isoform X2 n=1 Tax=Tachyglossus aculeatus TaxID=9261 RepID=UPI0018F56794|nr:methyltransferase-like protein 22 isoform X2 [Tachyglossus aculeatus]XP_038619499.1 methyltransferase-like protein 22 isoform X2 [Tachyglossus aculeatus]